MGQEAAVRSSGRWHDSPEIWHRTAGMSDRASGIRNLKRQAVLALLLPHLGPRFMHRALRVVGRRFRAGNLDRINTAEILELVARGFQPDILDTRNLSRHILDAVDGLFPIVVRYIVPEFVDHHVQHRLRLPKSVLHCGAAGVQRPRRYPRREYRRAQRDLRSAFPGYSHVILRNCVLASFAEHPSRSNSSRNETWPPPQMV